MKRALYILLTILLTLSISERSLNAAYVVQKGRLVDVSEAATMSPQAHFDAGAVAYAAENWCEAAKQFAIVTANFPTSTYGQEAYYFLGVSYYFLEEYCFANGALTEYLKVQGNPRYFQSTIEFKFAIAEQLNAGAKRRLLGTKKLPKWACGLALAIEIYDEVIAAVPCSDIAAQALMAKACLQWRMQCYRPAIDSLLMVIRRFPKFEQTPDCYVYIGKIYLEQSRFEFQNSDILSFAQINLRKFERDFPREERLCEAQQDVLAIKEIYAEGLYKTGRFYERTCKPRAAMIYYNDAIRQFPETCIASTCRNRMLYLNPSYCEERASVTGETVVEEEDSQEIDVNLTNSVD